MKLFNIKEANALIPTVRDILKALRRDHQRLQSFQKDAKHAAEGAENGGGGISRGSHHYCTTLFSLVERTSELDALGVQLKDYARGLVDFPTLREGRIVLLCWHLGEGDQVQWWHETDAGFAGRQPL